MGTDSGIEVGGSARVLPAMLPRRVHRTGPGSHAVGVTHSTGSLGAPCAPGTYTRWPCSVRPGAHGRATLRGSAGRTQFGQLGPAWPSGGTLGLALHFPRSGTCNPTFNRRAGEKGVGVLFQVASGPPLIQTYHRPTASCPRNRRTKQHPRSQFSGYHLNVSTVQGLALLTTSRSPGDRGSHGTPAPSPPRREHGPGASSLTRSRGETGPPQAPQPASFASCTCSGDTSMVTVVKGLENPASD